MACREVDEDAWAGVADRVPSCVGVAAFFGREDDLRPPIRVGRAESKGRREPREMIDVMFGVARRRRRHWYIVHEVVWAPGAADPPVRPRGDHEPGRIRAH